MAVVSTPPSMSSVISVFGGPGNLTAYYRGGPYVPNISQNAAIATSPGSLALSQFAGATNYVNVSASVSPATISKTSFGSAATGASGLTNPVTATGSGGTGSYTYAWTLISGDASTTISNSTTASVTFSRANCNTGVDYVSTWKCTVSDGTTSASGNVQVTLSYNQLN